MIQTQKYNKNSAERPLTNSSLSILSFYSVFAISFSLTKPTQIKESHEVSFYFYSKWLFIYKTDQINDWEVMKKNKIKLSIQQILQINNALLLSTLAIPYTEKPLCRLLSPFFSLSLRTFSALKNIKAKIRLKSIIIYFYILYRHSSSFVFFSFYFFDLPESGQAICREKER
ncbi:hypothetical protein FIM1_3022 [Kluyveromyces marxianus]|uniref:Transmembrane protein n=1 Tax=Kluyveromyces marxianus TaxID=4911 RepID=A0ABX6EX22_KLUMA|nr:hypothetical protein FIM1_3022 [Kluyveromyces marxianus]